MIRADDLEKIWEKLTYTGDSEFVFRRVDSGESVPEINIGLNSKLNRCLLLELPKIHNVDFQTTVKQNLTLSFFRDTGYIVLELTDSTYTDLFNDLIVSIYQHIYQIADVDEYSKIFIRMFYKWSEFFDDKKSEKLSLDVVKGLFGEMFVLKSLIEGTDSLHLNDLLDSWKGPYDTGHDFVLDQMNIEVKTKELSKQSVNISSEYQLEPEEGKELELLVLSVETDPVSGQSLRLLLSEIKEMVVDKLGDFSIVLTALKQKNITMQNIYLYDNYRFVPAEKTVYDCDNADFPKLTNSNTSRAIGSIRYSLHLSHIDNYILNIEKYHD